MPKMTEPRRNCNRMFFGMDRFIGPLWTSYKKSTQNYQL